MTAKNIRIILATVVSAYGVVSAAVKTNGIHLPAGVSAVLVAAAPIMLALQHYLSDPSTGTTPTSSTPVPTVLSQAAQDVEKVVETVKQYVDKTPTPAPAPVSAPEPPSPAPVPAPAEWSTLGAPAPQAPPPPNPAPPAPAA